MIIIKIMGGLGNQMFQYALARSIIEKGKKVKIDTTYYNNIPALDTNRKYELDLFPYSFEFATSREIKRYTSKLNYLKNIVGEYTHLYRSNIIVDREYEYNNNLVNCDNKYLVGYWQCERYFSDIRSILVDEFSFDNRALDEEDINLKNEIKLAKCPIAIHVRAGDYYNRQNIDAFGNICTCQYYGDACKYFANKYEDIQFFLFTDDRRWVEKNLNLNKYNIKIVREKKISEAWKDLYCMSLCDHNIISNSSFSWWSAWLNTNTHKEVISPTKWRKGIDAKKVIPSGWICI